MILATFRCYLRSELPSDTDELIRNLHASLTAVEGFEWTKDFVADDGEVLTLVQFNSQQALDEWKTNPVHMAAKARASEIMREYSVVIADVRQQIGPTSS